MDVEKLKADLKAMEARIPFVDYSDDRVASDLEDSAIEMENLRRDVVTFSEEGRRAATAKAERLLAEVTEKHYQLLGENKVRKDERTKESVLDQMAERKALLHRETALQDWTRRKEELEALLTRDLREGENEHYDIAPLREATEAVDWLTKAINDELPLTKAEIAARRSELETTFPAVRGSFKN